MTTFVEKYGERRRKRVEDGLDAWKRVQEKLAKMAVPVEMFGSISRRTAHPGSDLDILVLDVGHFRRGEILVAIEDAAEPFPVDVVFVEDLPESSLARMRKESIPI